MKTKYTLTTFSFLCLSLLMSANAQEKWSLGLEALARDEGVQVEGFPTNSSVTKMPMVGLRLGYEVRPGLHLETGFFFTRSVAVFRVWPSAYRNSVFSSLQNFVIPVGLRYDFFSRGRFTFSARGGIVYRHLEKPVVFRFDNATNSIVNGNQYSTQEGDYFYEVTFRQLRKHQLSLQGGLEASFRVSRHFEAALQANYTHGLGRFYETNVRYRKGQEPFQTTQSHTKGSGWNAGLSLRFRF
ncbi:hypothetical protein DR864_21060 [Runella rosea]|uniref:Outer membrane protein beta-barrel domain-containing protein n=1 Tax=Runella rosea TaxID=2259595 RepID=A0A344TN40_9BACT|nr:outer membrane beta-barrel protein [Runella rosea]AXE20061.1 hypothetical protein DR864_21060 [Runella rosea]